MDKRLKKTFKTGGIYEIIYRSESGVWTKRRIKVLRISESCLPAYCFYRGGIRTFKFENIYAVSRIDIFPGAAY